MLIFICFTITVLFLWLSGLCKLAPHCGTGPTKYLFKLHRKSKIYTEPWGSQMPDECKYTFLCAHESVLQWYPELS